MCNRISISKSLRAWPVLAALALSTLAMRASAEPAPTIAGAPQVFIQRGQSIDVTLDGNFLATVNSLAVSHARGLQAGIIDPDKNAKPDNAHLHVHLAVDADAALGTRELRLISPSGVSAPLQIAIGQYPQFAEKEPNNTPEQAQNITFPVTLVGKVDVPGDIDCFRFSASKGQQLVFDVHAVRDHSQLDPLLTIHNEAGHELAIKVDLHGGDPVVLFDVPEDGHYLLSVRDLQYRGSAAFTYRIDAGAIPYVQSVLPMSAQPGKTSEIQPMGVNLSGGTIPIDLTYAAEGREISVRAHASSGLSNPMTVDVNELPIFADQKPAHAAAGANAVVFPVDISGRVDTGGDDCYFKFHIEKRQVITLEAITGRVGSPLNVLLALRGTAGNVIQTADDSTGVGARITREVDPADYLVSIRDLYYNGGPRYAYRLQIRPGGAAGAASEKDFAVRFLPDTIRISRGGNAVAFVDLQRKGDFKGDVSVALEDLPTGVSCAPIVINDKLPGASGMLVLSAAPEAAAGSFSIHVRASATVGNSIVNHEGAPLFSGRQVDEAYLTVLDAAPFTIEPAPGLTAPRIQQLSTEADALAAKLAAANPQLAAAQAEWEKKFAEPLVWTPLDDVTATAVAGTMFKRLDDDSILAGGVSPATDTYTATANTDLPGITAVRLEAIPDPSLPNQGPGRGGSGNFVLSHLTATIAPGGAPTKITPITFHHPVADFEQDGYAAINALEPKPGRGWAMYPHNGAYNKAVFFTTQPAGTAEGSTLTFVFDQQFGQQHTLGRFRLSITTDPQAEFKASLPAKIAAIVAIPLDKRSAEDKTQIADYYRSIDPQISQDTARLQAIRSLIGMPMEVARLQAALTTDSAELQAEQGKWEKSIEAGAAWLPLDLTSFKSQSGATLTKQPDESIFVSGIDPVLDTYTLTGTTPLANISAIRVEALPDPRLPGGGPGRAFNGNFVLSGVTVFAAAKDAVQMNPPITFKSARATFEQAQYPVANALNDSKDSGWAVSPNVGKPSVATFYPSEAFGSSGGTTLTVLLDHQASFGHHTLGRFRISVTGNANPDTAITLPAEILAILKVPAEKRDAKQKADLAEYFRSIAPSLEPIRRELAEVKSAPDYELIVARGKKVAVPFLLNRAGFTGDVRVTLEGFVSGRDPNSGAPASLNGSLKFEPLNLPANKPGSTLEVQVEGGSAIGPRYCVLRAEGKAGDDMRVEYSPPFVLTVLEK